MDYLLFALLGLIVGAAVNALADALPAGKLPGAPRYADGRPRPLIAWLGAIAFLCRPRSPTRVDIERFSDLRRLGWRCLLVELTQAALMTLTYAHWRRGSMPLAEELLIWATFAAMFLLVAVADIEHRRVLLAPLIAIVVLAGLGALALPRAFPRPASMLAGALCAGLVFSFVYRGGLVFARLAAARRGQSADLTAFGRGDVYLMTAGGFLVGFPNALALMALAILLGGMGSLLFVLAKVAWGSGYKPFTALPYAPFILASVYAVMLFHDDLGRLVFGL